MNGMAFVEQSDGLSRHVGDRCACQWYAERSRWALDGHKQDGGAMLAAPPDCGSSPTFCAIFAVQLRCSLESFIPLMTQAPTLKTPDDRDSAATAGKTRGRRGRPVVDREARRASYLAAATSVVAREGYAGASLRKVAEEAGCTTGSLLHYFENKEAMVKALVESHFDQFESFIGSSHDPNDIKATFKQWLKWTSADDPARWLVQFQLIAQARLDPELAAIFRQRYAQYRRKRVALLERGQKEGLIRSDISADMLADNLSAIGEGWMMMLPIEPERFKPSRIEALLDAVITLISPPGPSTTKSAAEEPAVRKRRH